MKKRAPAQPKRPRGRPAHKTSPRPRNLRELAGPLGVSYQTALKLRKDGLIHVEKDGTYDVATCKRAAAQSASRGKAGSFRVGAGDEGPISSEAKRWDTEWRKAKALDAQIDLKKKLGQLVEKSDVRQAWGERTKPVKDALMVLGREMEQRLFGKSRRDIRAIVDGRIIEILKMLAHKEFNPDA